MKNEGIISVNDCGCSGVGNNETGSYRKKPVMKREDRHKTDRTALEKGPSIGSLIWNLAVAPPNIATGLSSTRYHPSSNPGM